MRKEMLFVLAIVVSSATFAQPLDAKKAPLQSTKPIIEFSLCYDVVGSVMTRMKSSNEISRQADAGRACLDRLLGLAVETAGDNADLRAAIKELYIKQRNALGALGGSDFEHNQADNAYFDANNRVSMELKLAGLSD